METLKITEVIASFGETFRSFLVLCIMVWIVYRVFILTKRIVKGWDKR